MKAKTRTPRSADSGGPPKWMLGYLEEAEREARKFLTDDQYAHVVQLFDELAYEPDPAQSKTQRVEKIDDFYELKDKGGVLGKINVRVYFALFDERRLIFILCAYKKEDEGQTPPHIKIRVRNRLRIVRRQLARAR